MKTINIFLFIICAHVPTTTLSFSEQILLAFHHRNLWSTIGALTLGAGISLGSSAWRQLVHCRNKASLKAKFENNLTQWKNINFQQGKLYKPVNLFVLCTELSRGQEVYEKNAPLWRATWYHDRTWLINSSILHIDGNSFIEPYKANFLFEASLYTDNRSTFDKANRKVPLNKQAYKQRTELLDAISPKDITTKVRVSEYCNTIITEGIPAAEAQIKSTADEGAHQLVYGTALIAAGILLMKSSYFNRAVPLAY